MALTIAGGNSNQSGMNVGSGAQDLDRNIVKRRSNKSLATTMTQQSVDVFDQRYAVHVYQYADNLWIAGGEFLGHQLRTIGRTAQKAARAWRNAAIEKRLFGDGQTDRDA
jgi:hypothetical protein